MTKFRARRSAKMWRRASYVAIVVVLVVLSVFFVARWTKHRSESEGLKPLQTVAASFPVPAGAVSAFPDASSKSPTEVVKGWNLPGSLDSVCAAWRESYRSWQGANDVVPVEGEYVPGSSCTFGGKRGAYDVTLTVVLYGAGPPQAVLSVMQ